MFANLLNEIKPFVIVVGSYARGESRGYPWSDLDFYIRRRPQSEIDIAAFGEPEHYTDVLVNILRKYELEIESNGPGHIGIQPNGDIPILLEFSRDFKIPHNANLFVLDVYGVKMTAATDNKDIDYEETIDYFHLKDI